MSLEAQTTPWIHSAPIQIHTEATIAGTAEDIWDFFANTETWPNWFPGFRSAEYISEQPHGLGSVRVVQQRNYKVTEVITEWEPGKTWGMSVTDINFRPIKGMAEVVRFNNTPNNMTTVSAHIGVQLAWWARPLAILLKRQATKDWNQAWGNLANLTSDQADSSDD